MNAFETKKEESKKEKQTIGAVGLEFPQLLSAGYVTTKDLSNLINSFYHAVFSDYYGSKLEVAANGQISIRLFFKPSDVSGIKDFNSSISALESINKPSDTDAYSRIERANRFNNPNGNYRNYKFTDDAKEMLSEFVISSGINRNGGVNWNAVSEETTGSDNYNRPQIYVSLTCDIYKIIRKLYGDKTSNNGHWDYNIEVKAPIAPKMDPNGNVIATNYSLLLWRIDSSDVTALAARFGYGDFGTNSLGINTEM